MFTKRFLGIVLVATFILIFTVFSFTTTPTNFNIKTATKTRLFERSLTIVSAYFNLGSFKKGHFLTFDPVLYKKWAAVFNRLENNLIFYTDDQNFRDLIQSSRNHTKCGTKVIFLQNRTSSLWSFGLRNRIERIFNDPNYPKHYPNTVLADYPCAQHAKYELVAQSVNNRYFDSKYYIWLDVGYFRDFVKEASYFKLEVPSDINDSTIAYNQIAEASLKDSPKDIIRMNHVWIGGGMFIGTGPKVLEYFEQYKRAVHVFLNESLMNTDQQIVYAMFTESGRAKIHPTVELQLYIPKPPGNPWFYLGYHCMKIVNMTLAR